MYKLITFLIILAFTTACGNKGAGSSAKIKIFSGNMSDPQVTFPGGLLVMGRSLDGTQSFVLNYNPGLEIELKKGAWEFATLGWVGPAPMEGNQQCSYQSLDIKTDSFTINFDMNYASCLTMKAQDGSQFTNPMFYNYNNGNFNGFKKLQVKTCDSILTCITQKTPDSFRVEIPNTLKGIAPNATMSEKLVSSCIKGSSVSNITPPHGGVNGFIGTKITTFAAPTPLLNSPNAIAIDSNNNMFIAEPGSHVIRKLSAEGVLTTFAGVPGTAGFLDGPGSTALFNAPVALAIDSLNTIYVADKNNNRIRKINGDGTVGTLAGSGAAGSTDATGAAAMFNSPQGIAVNNTLGKIYVADTGNHKIRAITLGGVVTTFSGSGTAGHNDNPSSGSIVTFNAPQALAISTDETSATGYLYVADTGNSIIRKVAFLAGGSYTVAGAYLSVGSLDHATDPTQARFNQPTGIIVDAAGTIYISDTGNHTIRRMILNTSVSTLAGTAGLQGSIDGSGSDARFYYPAGLAVDSSLNVYVADRGNNTIRAISTIGEATTIAGTAGVAGSLDSGSLAGCAGAPKNYMFNHGFGEILNNIQLDQGAAVLRRGALSIKVDSLNSGIALAPFLGVHSSVNTLPPLSAVAPGLYFYNGAIAMTIAPYAPVGTYLYFNGANWSSFQETDSVKLLLQN